MTDKLKKLCESSYKDGTDIVTVTTYQVAETHLMYKLLNLFDRSDKRDFRAYMFDLLKISAEDLGTPPRPIYFYYDVERINPDTIIMVSREEK